MSKDGQKGTDYFKTKVYKVIRCINTVDFSFLKLKKNIFANDRSKSLVATVRWTIGYLHDILKKQVQGTLPFT